MIYYLMWHSLTCQSAGQLNKLIVAPCVRLVTLDMKEQSQAKLRIIVHRDSVRQLIPGHDGSAPRGSSLVKVRKSGKLSPPRVWH